MDKPMPGTSAALSAIEELEAQLAMLELWLEVTLAESLWRECPAARDRWLDEIVTRSAGRYANDFSTDRDALRASLVAQRAQELTVRLAERVQLRSERIRTTVDRESTRTSARNG